MQQDYFNFFKKITFLLIRQAIIGSTIMLFLNISGVPGHMSLTNQIMPMYNKCNVNENVNVKIILNDNADVRLFTCQWEGRGWQGTYILYIDRQTYGHCYS